MEEYEDQHVSINPIEWVTNTLGDYLAKPGSKLQWVIKQKVGGYEISLNALFPELGNAWEFTQMFQDGVDDSFTRRQEWELSNSPDSPEQKNQGPNAEGDPNDKEGNGFGVFEVSGAEDGTENDPSDTAEDDAQEGH